MTLPVTIGGAGTVVIIQGTYGPFRGYNGAIYTILIDDTVGNPIDIRAYKATDPTDSFSEQDSGNRPGINGNGAVSIAHLDCKQQGDDIHVVVQSANINQQDVYYMRFDMATDTWVAIDGVSDRDILINTPSQTSLSQYFCGFAHEFDNPPQNFTAVYAGNRTKFMGVDRTSVHYRESSDAGATWSAVGDTVADGGGANDYRGIVVCMPKDNSEQMHFFYVRNALDVMQRGKDNVSGLRTERDLTSLGVPSGRSHPLVRAMAYPRDFENNATELVRVIYEDINNDPHVYEMDAFSDDTDPTATDSDQQIVADTIKVTNEGLRSTPVMSCHLDGNTLYMIYAEDTDSDLQYHDDQASDTWQDDGEATAGTVNRVCTNVYDSDGPVLGIIYLDGTDVKYDEQAIPRTTTLLNDVDLSLYNSNSGPYNPTGNNRYGFFLDPSGHQHIHAVKATTATPIDADWNSVGTSILTANGGQKTMSPHGLDWVVSLFTAESLFAAWHFDASDAAVADPGAVWTNEDNIADGDKATEATVATSGSSASNYAEVQGTGVPAAGPTIQDVQIQVRASESAADAVLGIRVTTDAAGETLLDTTQALTTTDADFTFTLSTPSGGWTYAKVQALEVRVWRDSGSATLSVFGCGVIIEAPATAPFYHVAYQHESGRVGYSLFEAGGDTWLVRDKTLFYGPLIILNGDLAASIAVRSDGDALVAFNINTDRDLEIAIVEWGELAASRLSLTTAGELSNSTLIGPATDDRITAVYQVATDTLATRSIAADDTLGTQVNIDTAIDGSNQPIGTGVITSADEVYV